LLLEATKQPIHVKELVSYEATYKGTLYALAEGVDGVWLPGTRALAQIVWRYQWPEEVRARLAIQQNPTGDITNSDLEMAAKVLGWLVLEACVPLKWAHVGVCSDIMSTVAWATQWDSKSSQVANRLH